MSHLLFSETSSDIVSKEVLVSKSHCQEREIRKNFEIYRITQELDEKSVATGLAVMYLNLRFSVQLVASIYGEGQERDTTLNIDTCNTQCKLYHGLSLISTGGLEILSSLI